MQSVSYKKKRQGEEEATREDELPEVLDGQCVVQVTRSHGGNIFEAKTPGGELTLARLPTRFRNLIWVKRGAFLLCSSAEGTFETSSGSSGRVTLSVERVLYKEQIKHLSSQGMWPEEFQEALNRDIGNAGAMKVDNGDGFNNDVDSDGNVDDVFVNRNRAHLQGGSESELSSDDEF